MEIETGRGGEQLTCLGAGYRGQDIGSRTRERDAGGGTQRGAGLRPPGPQEAAGFLVEPLTHHLRGGGVPGKVMHSRRRQVMLIVLWDGPHLELSGTQAGVHTEVPAGTQVA